MSATSTEADTPRTGLLAVAVAVTVAVTALLVVGVSTVFGFTLREEIARKQLEPESTALRRLRSEEQARLGRYQWIDRRAGVVRIPTDRALELVLEEHERPRATYGGGR